MTKGLQESRMREICTSGSMRGSGRRALFRKCPLSLSTLLRFNSFRSLKGIEKW